MRDKLHRPFGRCIKTLQSACRQLAACLNWCKITHAFCIYSDLWLHCTAFLLKVCTTPTRNNAEQLWPILLILAAVKAINEDHMYRRSTFRPWFFIDTKAFIGMLKPLDLNLRKHLRARTCKRFIDKIYNMLIKLQLSAWYLDLELQCASEIFTYLFESVDAV